MPCNTSRQECQETTDSGSRSIKTPRRSHRTFPLLTLAVLLAAAGCVEHDVVIKLRPDGSGEIVETTVARGEMVEAMMAMKDMEGAEAEDGSAKAAARAARLGPGVSVVSWEELTEDGFGERTVYAFEDINRITVGQAPDNDEDAPGGEDRVGFRFTRDGGVSQLVAVLAPPTEAAADAPADAGAPTEASLDPSAGMDDMAASMGEGMMESMKPFLKGFKTRIVVEVEGDVVETNAPAVDGSTVTLMAFDFDQVIATEGAWEKMTALGDEQNLAVIGQALPDVPGVSVPSTPEVTVRFRGR